MPLPSAASDDAPDEAVQATVLSLTNQKGGVGKTTTAVNLGACLAEAGAKVLLIDLDPQGNASTGIGIDRSKVKVGTYEVLTGSPISDAILETETERLWAVPSTIDLAGAEVELVSAFAREMKLRQAITPIRGDFDFVLIDSPPSLGLLAVNALAAASEVVVPIQCEYYALEGVGQLMRTLELIREGLNPSLHVGGVVMTMFDARTKLAEQVVAEVRKYFGDVVFKNVIPRSVRLSEAPGFGKPIIKYASSSRAALAYRDLALEFLARWAPHVAVTRARGAQQDLRQPTLPLDDPAPAETEPAMAPLVSEVSEPRDSGSDDLMDEALTAPLPAETALGSGAGVEHAGDEASPPRPNIATPSNASTSLGWLPGASAEPAESAMEGTATAPSNVESAVEGTPGAAPGFAPATPGFAPAPREAEPSDRLPNLRT